jgi:metal-sulfur cluster biosynthetic enzyme
MAESMSPDMISKLEAVMDRVIDPQSELPLCRLELVEKFSYHEKQNTLKVYLDFDGFRSGSVVCTAINVDVKAKIEAALVRELEREFPTLWIRLA